MKSYCGRCAWLIGLVASLAFIPQAAGQDNTRRHILEKGRQFAADTVFIINNTAATVTYNLEVQSPDSTYLAYAEEPDPSSFNGNIWIMRPDGSEQEQLTSLGLDREPVWSPDGTKIVFHSLRSGVTDIWVINSDGTGATNLTENPAWDAYPTWSVDGQSIIFSSNRYDNNHEIYRMAPDGSNVERLTFNSLVDLRPIFSPDGASFVTQTRIPDSLSNIYVYSLSGPDSVILGIDGVSNFQPAWTPDGSRVIWSSGDDTAGDLDIWSARPDGSDLRVEYATPENDYIPRYSPDGLYLAFSKGTFTAMGGDEIFVWRKPIDRLTQVTNATPVTMEWGPSWSPFMGTPAWITASKTSVILAAGESDTVALAMNGTSLPPGDHIASLMVRDAADGQLIEVIPVVLSLPAPTIDTVVDVPNDQGRWVHISWFASAYDGAYGDITQYGVWEAAAGDTLIGLGNIPATQAPHYIFRARTLGDSSMADWHWSHIVVTAHTTTPLVYYTSAIDSGYSVDNIAPTVPSGVIAVVTQPNAIDLAWDEPADEDFAFFRVYRGSAAGFDLSNMEPISELLENSFSDADLAVGSAYYYRISAVDANGNESAYSPEVSATALSAIGGILVPVEYALHQNYPNPFNPTSTIQYDLPEAANVTLVVYDIIGREAVRLVDQQMQPGYHNMVWDGRDHSGRSMPTGIYIARLVTPDYAKSIKMLLLK